MVPNPDLIRDDNLLSKNLIMPGPFPYRLQGAKIIESQILHIRSDYQNGKLNRENIVGGNTKWGDLETDTPSYYFKYLPLLKAQQLIQKR